MIRAGRVSAGLLGVALMTAAVVAVLRQPDAAPDDGELGRLLVTAPSGDYAPGPAGVNGGLSRGAAAATTVVPREQLERLLRDYDFSAGASRVWVHGADFQSAVALRLDDEGGAQAVADLVLDEVRSIPGGAVFPLAGVPGVTAFSTPSRQPGQRASVFCQGAILVQRQVAVQLLECTAAPPGLGSLLDLAKRQQARLAVTVARA